MYLTALLINMLASARARARIICRCLSVAIRHPSRWVVVCPSPDTRRSLITVVWLVVVSELLALFCCSVVSVPVIEPVDFASALESEVPIESLSVVEFDDSVDV